MAQNLRSPKEKLRGNRDRLVVPGRPKVNVLGIVRGCTFKRHDTVDASWSRPGSNAAIRIYMCIDSSAMCELYRFCFRSRSCGIPYSASKVVHMYNAKKT